jgi:hypothetical protein
MPTGTPLKFNEDTSPNMNGGQDSSDGGNGSYRGTLVLHACHSPFHVVARYNAAFKFVPRRKFGSVT